ncbi:hypothetical protein Pcinc_041023 [Petrolisthes cinctipes]|uniref:Ectonucleotide pyrophosphatase/phosphodiesterase family member 6 n=1 Tax=Petrolisthes cinctipes TaxID=88211 RepID=A0AAE1EI68_PETCI|nr:hypothetical protein Pcinc_041023 [Petrolisthes cinctipes]
MKTSWVQLCLCVSLCLVSASPDHHHHNMQKASRGMRDQDNKQQLLYILLDGFRWDYLDKVPVSELPGFTKLLKEGGRARWTNPLFPSLSYPTWTTLATGLHAEYHGIVGNYFYDPVDKDIFSLFDTDATGKSKWWTAEPLWTTAEKAGLKTAQYLWSRCDVPFDGVTTHFCEYFVKIPGKDIFMQNIGRGLNKLSEGYDLVQVYTEHADNTGHTYGPDAPNILQMVKDLDDVIHYLLTQLQERELTDKVNIVIVSDHGMTSTASEDVNMIELDDYLDSSLVEHIADAGAFMNIKVPQQNVDKVYEQVSQMPSVNAYRREDVPERFHYSNNKYIHEIILQADMGTFIMGSRSGKQLPPRYPSVSLGGHGYNPDYQNMKGIFFAKGPAFNCEWLLEPIHVVDVYQVLTHVLGITPQPHNGTWSRVEPAFAFNNERKGCNAAPIHGLSTSLVACLVASFLYSVYTLYTLRR